MRWHIINGNIKGNEERKWIFTGGIGESVIDYIIGDGKREGIEKIVTGENMDLDHHLLIVWVKIKEKERRGYKSRDIQFEEVSEKCKRKLQIPQQNVKKEEDESERKIMLP